MKCLLCVYATNHDYQDIYDQCTIKMPRGKELDLRIKTGERHWYSGHLDNKRTRNLRKAEQDKLLIGGNTIDLAQDTESMIEDLTSTIIAHVKHSF